MVLTTSSPSHALIAHDKVAVTTANVAKEAMSMM